MAKLIEQTLVITVSKLVPNTDQNSALPLTPENLAEIASVVEALADIRSEIESTLIDAQETINEALTEAVDRMADAKRETIDFDNNIDHYGTDYVGHYDYIRNAVTAAVYSLAFLVFVILTIGLLTLIYLTTFLSHPTIGREETSPQEKLRIKRRVPFQLLPIVSEWKKGKLSFG